MYMSVCMYVFTCVYIYVDRSICMDIYITRSSPRANLHFIVNFTYGPILTVDKCNRNKIKFQI